MNLAQLSALSARLPGLLHFVKSAALGLIVFFAGFGAGCVSSGASDHAALIQSILNETVPADFRGDTHLEHKNSYFNVTIDAGDLHKENSQWTWAWLTYKRNGLISYGIITLGTPPSIFTPRAPASPPLSAGALAAPAGTRPPASAPTAPVLR